MKNNLKPKKAKEVKEAKYRHVFCDEYNLSFFKPKKDQCTLCEAYNRKKDAGTLDNHKALATIRNVKDRIPCPVSDENSDDTDSE